MNPERRAELFAERLATQTDVADVHAAMQRDDPGFVLVDTRSDEAWRQGRIPGAVRMGEVPAGVPVVTYCWGPACNGATKAALAFARDGREVREMIGGIEYWIREGFGVENAAGIVTRPVDQLCGC